MNQHTRAIILMNLGSPDSTDVKDVKRFLNEFLMDGRVIDKPFLLRTLLVRGIIVPFRAKNSAEAYNKIWTKEGSPLIVISKQLQKAVQANFEEPVELVMRYQNPAAAAVLKKLHEENPQLKEILILPLYPHYAMSSYETAVEDIKHQHKKKNYASVLKVVKPFYNNEQFVYALSESIKPYLQKEYDKILFSYHGVPERHIRKSDITGQHCLQVNRCCHIASPAHKFCYRHQTIVTTELVTKTLNIPEEKVEQTYQSRLGKDPWLLPSTQERLPKLPGEGVKRLLVVCPAFVSDCLETLEEIAIQARKTFLDAGGESFEFIPCMNTQPLWVQTVSNWIKDYFNGSTEMLVD
ncbi:ferrochelatase [Parafilimonas sp.]|uniref:ferrochelatase n=1 Tax=Parafilimonas sp. TaxID=1969739 RepID=UPI003F807115